MTAEQKSPSRTSAAQHSPTLDRSANLDSAAPAASTDPTGEACGTCGTERPIEELAQAYSFSYEPIEGRLWCRDKDACYQAWAAL